MSSVTSFFGGFHLVFGFRPDGLIDHKLDHGRPGRPQRRSTRRVVRSPGPCEPRSRLNVLRMVSDSCKRLACIVVIHHRQKVGAGCALGFGIASGCCICVRGRCRHRVRCNDYAGGRHWIRVFSPALLACTRALPPCDRYNTAIPKITGNNNLALRMIPLLS